MPSDENRGGVGALAFSPDSKTLITGSSGFVIKVWDVKSGAEKLTIQDLGPPLAVSPDGQTLAALALCCVDFTLIAIKLVDLQTGDVKQILTGHAEGEITSVAFSADGNSICTGNSDKSVNVWDAKTGALKTTLSGHLSGHWRARDSEVLSVALSPDGKMAASGSEDGTLTVWNVPTGAAEQTIKMDDQVEAVTLSRQGDLGACIVLPGTVKIWDAHTGAVKQTITGDARLTSLSFSPDGKLLAGGSYIPAGGSYDYSVRVWDVGTGEEKMILKGHTGMVLSVAFSPDGKLLASGSKDETVRLWE